MKKPQKIPNLKKSTPTSRSLSTHSKPIKKKNTTTIDLKQHFAAIIESSDDAIIGKTLDGIIQSWNRAAQQMYGYTAKQAIGQPIMILVPDDHQDEIPGILKRIKKGQGIDHYETVRRRKDGHNLQVSLTISPIKDSQAKVIGASTIARDITERKQWEKIHLHLAAIVESSDDAIIGKTLDGTIQSWNRAAQQMYGYTAKQAIGQSITILVPDDHQDEISGILKRIKKGQVIDHFETVRRRKDGHDLQVSLTISPIKDSKGKLIGASTIARDITERKQWEILRAQLLLKTMTAQEEERRRIARELHDETAQSLTSLLVGLRVLEEAKNIKDSRDHIRYLRTLTSDMMKEVHRVAMGLRSRVLDDLGLEVALRRQIEDVNKTTGMNIDLDVLGTDIAHLPSEAETGLYRVFQEALTNAIRHANAKVVSVFIRHKAGVVRMVIEDDGSGFNVEKALQGKISEENLGLHGMRERANLLGGTCIIESTPNRGTLVQVEIPVPV